MKKNNKEKTPHKFLRLYTLNPSYVCYSPKHFPPEQSIKQEAREGVYFSNVLERLIHANDYSELIWSLCNCRLRCQIIFWVTHANRPVGAAALSCGGVRQRAISAPVQVSVAVITEQTELSFTE